MFAQPDGLAIEMAEPTGGELDEAAHRDQVRLAAFLDNVVDVLGWQI